MANIYIILAVIPALVCSNTEGGTSVEVPPIAPATGTLEQITTSDDIVEASTDHDVVDIATTATPAEEITTSTPGVSRNCGPAEVALWTGNYGFSLAVSRIAHSHLGSASLTVIDLVKEYQPILTEQCASCFGENVSCGAKKCWMYCTFSSFSQACLTCTNTHCNPGLKTCLGVEDHEMPPVPTEDMDTTTTTSTFAPRKRPVRTTTASPSDDVSSMPVVSTAPAQALRQTSFLDTLPQNIPRNWYVYVSVLVGLVALVVSRISG